MFEYLCLFFQRHDGDKYYPHLTFISLVSLICILMSFVKSCADSFTFTFFLFSACSSCTPTRGKSDTRSSGSHSDAGPHPAECREPPHPTRGIHRAAFTRAPALSLLRVAPGDTLCSKSTFSGWIWTRLQTHSSPLGLIPSSLCKLTLNTIYEYSTGQLQCWIDSVRHT